MKKVFIVYGANDAKECWPPGEPAILYHTNRVIWVDREGKLHRTDGPAVVFYHDDHGSEDCWWYNHGELHRFDGPAYKNEYWLYGKRVRPNEAFRFRYRFIDITEECP